MIGWLFLLFTLVPIVELYFLIQIGKVIGGLETIAAVVVIGVIGAALAKSQGLAVVRGVQRATAEGRMPGRELLEGAMVFAGGLLLVTPGVLTDVLGLLLLIPPVRRLAAGLVARRLAKQMKLTVVDLASRGPMPPQGAPRRPAPRLDGAGPIIDVTPDSKDER